MFNQYRLYSFVANMYLSPLQCGLQTAHVVSEISSSIFDEIPDGHLAESYFKWAKNDKTIIICGAGNHAGVTDCFVELEAFALSLGMPTAIFREDQASMNSMATACGIIVPSHYYDAKFVPDQIRVIDHGISEGVPAHWTYTCTNGHEMDFSELEVQFISYLKSFRLA